jgi:hypothetical protein
MWRNGGIPALSGIQGVVFHSFRGKRAWWSSDKMALLDVSKVSEVYCKKRMFKIFDRGCDYKVVIRYKDPSDVYISGIGVVPFIPVISYGCRAMHVVLLKRVRDGRNRGDFGKER